MFRFPWSPERRFVSSESPVAGKSTAALSIARLLPDPPAIIARGRVHFGGRDLLTLSPAELRKVRGGEIGFVFQDPGAALNPVLSVGFQVAETLFAHFPDVTPTKARLRAAEWLKKVGVDGPERYPHQLSGGMRQRVTLAAALIAGPKLLVADEPTTSLDVTIQKQILTLIAELRRELGMGVLLITHDLGIVAENADSVCVMRQGKVVERASREMLFVSPQHAYTRELIAAARSLDAP